GALGAPRLGRLHPSGWPGAPPPGRDRRELAQHLRGRRSPRPLRSARGVPQRPDRTGHLLRVRRRARAAGEQPVRAGRRRVEDGPSSRRRYRRPPRRRPRAGEPGDPLNGCREEAEESMSSQVSINGLQVNYLLEGPEDAPVVTFSHSLSANLGMWDAQAAALRERYRVLRYDTRGHGGTTATEGAYTLEQLAEDAAGLLRALDIDRTHFVGLSL